MIGPESFTAAPVRRPAEPLKIKHTTVVKIGGGDFTKR